MGVRGRGDAHRFGAGGCHGRERVEHADCRVLGTHESTTFGGRGDDADELALG